MLERIIAAVVDTRLLTLYREDGSTIEIPQGDPRVRGIIAQVMPVVQAGGVAEVDLSYLPNAYKEFEQKSSGLIRLFRVAKKAVAAIFGSTPESSAEIDQVINEGGVLGTLPNTPSAAPPQATMQNIDEILAQAEPVSHENFKDSDTTEEHTMIAVVADKQGVQTVIPGVESLKEQFSYSGKLGSTKGMEAFFQRLAPMIDKRGHSVEDLLRFLEKGDLPIADDGSIVAYKRLYKSGDRYVDPHTKSVSQTVGSYVCLAEDMVDLNRRNECSNGLHIGRRGYMRGFHGDSMFMCKIDPEDVMVVPHNDPNKIRVKGYHILAKLNPTAFNLITSNKPATSDAETAKLLSKVIAGQHIERTEEVRIHGSYGKGTVITPLRNGKPIPKTAEPAPAKHTALDDGQSGAVNPKEVATQVSEAKQISPRQQRALELMLLIEKGDVQAARDLMAMKKAAKVSWSSMGITEAGAEKATELATMTEVAPTPAPVSQEVQASKEPAPVQEPAPVIPQTAVRSKVIQGMLDILYDEKASNAEREAAGNQLLTYRKTNKKGWPKLGFPALTDDLIRARIADLPKAPVAKPEAEAKRVLKASAPGNTRARALYEAESWKDLWTFKKTAKKSWEKLGFNADEEATINLYKET